MAPRKDFFDSTPTAEQLQELYDIPDHGKVPTYVVTPLEEALNNHDDVILAIDSLYELACDGSESAIKALAALSEFALRTAIRCKEDWVERVPEAVPSGGAA